MSANSQSRIFLSYRQLIEHLRTPLFLNGYFLTLSSLATSGIGLIYWILAAHRYSTYTVGLNSAVIAAMTFLAGISELNLMSALIRFIPTTGRSTRRFVVLSYLVSLIISATIGGLFLLKLDVLSPALDFLGDNRILAIWFVLSTMAWCIFVLQDSVLTGLRQASWVPLENTIFSVAKIVLMIVFATGFPALGIFASWSIALIIAILPTNFLIFHRLIPAHVREHIQTGPPVKPLHVIRFAATDYLGAVSWIIASTLMPIIVTTVSGATANAYFFLAWTIANTLYLISTSMGSSLVVEAAKDQAKLSLYSHKVFTNTLKIIIPTSLLIIVSAPYILTIFGKGYSQAGTTLLRLLVLSAIPNIVNTIFVSISRVQRRTTLVALVLGSLCMALLGSSYIFLKIFGIVGVGYAWVISQTTVATIVYATRLRVLWKTPRQQPVEPKRSLANAISNIPWSGILYRFATGTQIYPYLSQSYQKWTMYTKQSRLTSLLPGIINALPREVYDPSKETWKVQSVARNDTRTTVAFLGPPDGTSSIVIKLPGNEKEAESLRRQSENLGSLNRLEHLGEWRLLLPKIIAMGEIHGQTYFIEQVLPGLTLQDLLCEPQAVPSLANLATAVIDVLHRKTAQKVVIDMGILQSWVQEPMDHLINLTSSRAITNIHQKLFGQINAKLQEALLGRQVYISWIHGDYFPANILMNPKHTEITGIVDWDLARSDELPLIDLMHFLISIRMRQEHREMGLVVSDLLTRRDWKPYEKQLMQSSEHKLEGDQIDLRVILLLTWLRHINANLNKTARFDHHRRWIENNIATVLQTLDES